MTEKVKNGGMTDRAKPITVKDDMKPSELHGIDRYVPIVAPRSEKPGRRGKADTGK